MTKEEFLAHREANRRDPTRHRVPFGWIHSLTVGFFVGGLAVLGCSLYELLSVGAGRLVLLLAFSWSAFGASLLWAAAGRRKLVRMAFICPACQDGIENKTEEAAGRTGRCQRCGARLYEAAPTGG